MLCCKGQIFGNLFFVSDTLAMCFMLESTSSSTWYTKGFIFFSSFDLFVKGVAGGVNFLVSVGAGKYTVDELLAKKE